MAVSDVHALIVELRALVRGVLHDAGVANHALSGRASSVRGTGVVDMGAVMTSLIHAEDRIHEAIALITDAADAATKKASVA